MSKRKKQPVTVLAWNPEPYLPNATDFTDMVKRDPPKVPDNPSAVYGKGYVECPLCKGYGGWNLRLNAYGKPGDSPNMRHFRASCSQCWGWSYVEPGVDVTCVHEFVEVAPDQPWRCWHTIECKKCGRRQSYDSSD